MYTLAELRSELGLQRAGLEGAKMYTSSTPAFRLQEFSHCRLLTD